MQHLTPAVLLRRRIASTTSFLKSATRSWFRNCLGAILRWLPTRIFLALREGFPETAETALGHRLRRRLLEVSRHRGVPDDVHVFSPVDNPGISLVRADSFVTERLYWFGERYGYEPGGIYWWRQFCEQVTHILELGANIGYYTVQGAKVAPSAHYTAVEPHPGCAATCRRNVHANGLTNVNVVEAAAVAYAKSPKLSLMLPRGHDHYMEAPSTGFVGHNELHRSDADDPYYDSIVVPAVELRSLIANVDLIKLDVEGLEYELLLSIQDTLLASRPTIFLELLDDTPLLRTLVADLCDRGIYRCYIPTRESLVPLTTESLRSLTVRARLGVRDVVLTSHALPR